MKIRLLAVALMGAACAAQADHGADEPRLTAESKALRVEILKDALRNKNITQEQFEKSVSWVYATPCDGVDRSLNAKRRAVVGAAIAREQGLRKVQVFESFRRDGWSILFTDASVGDEPYLFYSRDPVTGAHPIGAWSGAAVLFETSEIGQWVRENVPGIPARLADCFA